MMTNVRASNLHPTFLLRDTLPYPGPTRFKAILLRPVSSRQRIVDLLHPTRSIRPAQNPELGSTERRRNPHVETVCGKARCTTIKSTFWQIASVFIMWEYFRGRQPAEKYTRMTKTTFARLDRYGVLFSLPFPSALQNLALYCRKKRV